MQDYRCAAGGPHLNPTSPLRHLQWSEAGGRDAGGDPVLPPRRQRDPALPLPLRAGPGLSAARAHQMVEAVGEWGPGAGRAGGHWAETAHLWGLPRPGAPAAGQSSGSVTGDLGPAAGGLWALPLRGHRWAGG